MANRGMAWGRMALAATGTAMAVTATAALPADPAASDADLCVAAAEDAQRLSGVPLDVLLAVSLTETGRGGRPWPWTVNLEGEGHWFATRQDAVAFAEAALAQGRTSFDVGCFQLNWRWHGDSFVSVAQAFDPLANASYAARFLKDLEAESGDWSVAAGAYHSRTPDKAASYRTAFDAHRERLAREGLPPGDGAPPVALASARGARANLFPLLQGGPDGAGGGPRLGSLVPLGG